MSAFRMFLRKLTLSWNKRHIVKLEGGKGSSKTERSFLFVVLWFIASGNSDVHFNSRKCNDIIFTLAFKSQQIIDGKIELKVRTSSKES